MVSPLLTTENGIEYTISTFGFVDYQSKMRIELKQLGDKTGCSVPSSFSHEESQYHIGILAEKGECTYIAKAQNGHRVGARFIFVSLTDEDEDPDSIIPIAPKEQSVNVPPVVIISKKIGDSIRKYLKRGEKVFMNIDFDMVSFF